MKTFRLFSASILLLASFATGSAAATTPDEHAEAIARRSQRVVAHWHALQAEARKITDPRLRADFLMMLDRPSFKVMSARLDAEAEITTQLKNHKLLDADFSGPLFPRHPAMAFIAAPGGPWNGHHSFPGGLVYHTLTNLKLGLSYLRVYREVYQVNLDEDLIRQAALWHDSAKTVVLGWQEDGSLASSEPVIAGTPSHHIWGIAEALYRGYSPRFVVTLASSHNPPSPGAEAEKVVGYLRAGALIAGKAFETAGLTADGQALALSPPLEGYVTHLDDHDYILMVPSLTQVRKFLSADSTTANIWKQDEILSTSGDLPIFETLSVEGDASAKRMVGFPK
jgi:hypothetical protein